jgi:hypothetical protein
MWQHYSLEGGGHEEERRTDGNGYVVFPERKIWAPLSWRVVSTSLSVVSIFVHGGMDMGVSAWVMVEGYSMREEGIKFYQPGKPLPSEIRLARVE